MIIKIEIDDGIMTSSHEFNIPSIDRTAVGIKLMEFFDRYESIDKHIKSKITINDGIRTSWHEFDIHGIDGRSHNEELVEFFEAFSVFDDLEAPTLSLSNYDIEGTVIGRLFQVITSDFSGTWFSPQELEEKYKILGESIKKSTLSTYLFRLTSKGLLEVKGNKRSRMYKLVPNSSPESVDIKTPIRNTGTKSIIENRINLGGGIEPQHLINSGKSPMVNGDNMGPR